MTTEETRRKAVQAFYKIREVPYVISRKTPEEMKEGGKGSCYHKHAWLAEELQELGIPVKFVTYQFKWGATLSMPTQLKQQAKKLSSGTHLFLKVKMDGNWLNVDATWNSMMKEHGFPVNEWNGKTSTRLAVKPLGEMEEFDSLEGVNGYVKKHHDTKPDKKQRQKYFQDFNEWIKKVQKAKP
jgi:hypothetical protein